MRKLLYRIPEILHDPVIIMDSLTVRGSYVFAGNVFDNSGNPVVVSLLPHPINRNGYQLDVHKITSAYAKDNAQHMLNKSKIEYISADKKITTAWEKRTGLQLPFENFPIGGYKTNISQREDVSNSAQNVIDNVPHVKRFSLDVPVKQTKDLIAVHNLDEENLDIPETAQNNVRNEDFSYNTLVNKPDIPIHFYKDMGMKTIPNGATRDQLISATQENIAKYNIETERPEYGSSYLYSKDVGAPVLINKKGIRHGMNRVSNLNANVHTALPLYFENVIVTNTANSSVGDNADFSYILNSAYKDDGGIHIVTINVFHSAKGYYASIDNIRDELYSIRESKKTEATAHSAMSTDQNGLSSFMASTINIAQLLDQVKETRARGDLSLDVLKHFNLDRDGNTITGLRHSLNIDDDIDAVFDDDLDEPFDDHTVSSIRGEDVLKEGGEALGSIHVSAADTYRLAQKLVSDYGLSGQTRALNADLQKVFDYMEKNKGNLNTCILNGVINDLARPYIDSITETVGLGEYDDIMSGLGEYEVSLTDKQLAEVKNAFGSLAIADLIDAAQPVQQSIFEGETADEMAQDMSLAIMKSYYDYAS